MAENESGLQETTSPAPSSSGDVELSEENLLALFGPDPAAKPAPPITSPPPAPAPPETVESALASLAAVQEEKIEEPPPPPVSGPKPAAAARRPAENSGANTLALLAAIKENRAGMLRSEAAAKPGPPPAQPAVPSAQPEIVARKAPAPEIVQGPPPQPEKLSPPVQTQGPVTMTMKSVAPPEKITAQARPKHSLSAAGPQAAAPTKITVTPPRAPIPQALDTRAPLPTPVASGATSEPVSTLDKIPGGRRTLLIVGAAIALGGVSAGLLVRSHRSAKPKAPVAVSAPAPAPASTFPLQLQVEPGAGGQINVHWNPQSTLVAQARDGRLVITESNQKPRTVSLPLDQLKSGRLIYQSQADRVEFRLEVVDTSGSVAEESVVAQAAGKPGTPASAAPVATAKAEPAPQPKADEAPQPTRAAPRAFTPPTTVRSTVQQRAIVDAPPVIGNMPVAVPGISAQLPSAAAPPPPPPAPAKTSTPSQPVQIASALQASKLVTRVTPPYPPLAKSAHVQGTVRLQATIAKDGSVQDVQVMSGPPLLRAAAADAVKRWVYRPTLLNGQAVEVVTQIDVAFTLGQ